MPTISLRGGKKPGITEASPANRALPFCPGKPPLLLPPTNSRFPPEETRPPENG